jgi:hypothetical protein
VRERERECVCVRERERECVCVRERERERERERDISHLNIVKNVMQSEPFTDLKHFRLFSLE